MEIEQMIDKIHEKIEWVDFIVKQTWSSWDWVSYNYIETKKIFIWNILDYLEKNYKTRPMIHSRYKDTTVWFVDVIYYQILELWNDKTKPLESQQKFCIQYIYNLIYEEWTIEKNISE